MMPDNDFYGHRTAMARYCGLKQLSPAVFGTIRHGWRPDLGPIGGRSIPSAPYFVWNERHRREADEQGVPNVIDIGAPFLYAVATLDAGAAGPPLGAGTIAFPFHSGGGGQAIQDRDRFIRQVEAEESGPYTASIFYQELDDPSVVGPFRDAGWRIVSFGTRADPMFLPRLIVELVAHRTVVGDGLSSAIWYGASLGRRVRVVGPPPVVILHSGDTYSFDYAARWPEIHEGGLEGPRAVELADIELGRSSMREPAELADLLGWGTWRHYAAVAGRLAIDARHGNDFRMGRVQSRAMRRQRGRQAT